VVEVSLAAVVPEEVSAVSAFLDFEDFLVVEAEVSAGVVEESAAVDFFDLEDFLVVEVSVEVVVELSSVAAFFLDLEFVVVSLWSVD